MENLTSENHREFIWWASKIVHEWNMHLEIFSRHQAQENSRKQFAWAFSEQILYRKQSVGAPDISH